VPFGRSLNGRRLPQMNEFRPCHDCAQEVSQPADTFDG
jgi:hypothetical protein